jgi:hypothetical protein
VLLINESIKCFGLFTIGSEIGPFKLIALKTWELISDVKEYCDKNVNLGIIPVRTGGSNFFTILSEEF